MKTFAFGGEKQERLAVVVFGYERSALSGDSFDDNWLRVEVRIAAGAFTGKFQATFLTSDLAEFHSQGEALLESLSGSAGFETMEGQLAFKIEGNGRGNMTLQGKAQDQAGVGNSLEFELMFDQTQLNESIAQLRLVLDEYPIRA